MKLRTALVCGACVAGGLMAGVVAGRQDGAQPGAEPAGKPSREAIIEMMSGAGKPAEEHKVLEQLVGTFDVKGTLTLAPGLEISWASDGRGESILGGRFVQLDIATKPGDKPVVASKTIFGFDTRRAEYTMWGIDTFGTYSVSASGAYDAATKTLTLTGTDKDGGRTMKFRMTYVFGDTGYATTFEMEMAPGVWSKAGQWEARRTK